MPKRHTERSMTRYLMSASAIVLGILGLLTTFAPDYVLRSIGAPELPALLLMTQIVGALYMGFAGLNWMARDNLIGGIRCHHVATPPTFSAGMILSPDQERGLAGD